MKHPLQDRVVFFLAALCLAGGIAGGTVAEYFMTKHAAQEVNQ